MSEEKEQIDNMAQGEIERLKEKDKILQAQIQRLNNNEQIFMKLSSLLGEALKSSHQTTYLLTMVKDIIDGRNMVINPSS